MKIYRAEMVLLYTNPMPLVPPVTSAVLARRLHLWSCSAPVIGLLRLKIRSQIVVNVVKRIREAYKKLIDHELLGDKRMIDDGPDSVDPNRPRQKNSVPTNQWPTSLQPLKSKGDNK